MNFEGFSKSINNWEAVALTKGMTSQEIALQNAFVFTKLEQNCQTLYCKRIPGTLPRAVEFIVTDKNVTVITHLKSKGNQQPLGSGFQSVVKSSIVTYSTIWAPGTIIADKVPQNDENYTQHIKQLAQEATFLTKFTHASSVRQLVAGPQDRLGKQGLLLLGMQHSLKDKYSPGFPFTTQEKIQIAKDLVHALKEMKDKGVVHRDIHMGNCGLTYDGKWIIHDFGLAQDEGTVEKTHTSLKISSPKIIQNKLDGNASKACHSDDAWALAIILYKIEYNNDPAFILPLHTMEKISKGLVTQSSLQDTHALYTKKVALVLSELEINAEENETFLLSELILALFKGSGNYEELASDLTYDEIPMQPSESTENLLNDLALNQDGYIR
ncbi:MAG: protein kinase [Chlamydiales bacterium]|nr:protein kinase [Chlamydiales bacterium]